MNKKYLLASLFALALIAGCEKKSAEEAKTSETTTESSTEGTHSEATAPEATATTSETKEEESLSAALAKAEEAAMKSE